MGFIAGFIVGISGGALSWIAAAAWLESRRHGAIQYNAPSGNPCIAPVSGLRRQPSRS